MGDKSGEAVFWLKTGRVVPWLKEEYTELKHSYFVGIS